MWFTGLKVDKLKTTTKQFRVDNDTKYAFFRDTNNRFGAFANVRLTPFKIYKIIKTSGSTVSVVNDKGTLKIYNSDLFYKIDPDTLFDILDKESMRETQISRLLK